MRRMKVLSSKTGSASSSRLGECAAPVPVTVRVCILGSRRF